MDESYMPVFPYEARIRNLTYATEIYVDAKLVKLQLIEPEKTSLRDGEKKEAVWKVLRDDYETK